MCRLVAEGTEQLELSVTLGAASFTGSGPADQVMAALERFSALMADHATAASEDSAGAAAGAPADSSSEPDAGTAAPTPPQQSTASKMPLPKFLERDSVKSNPEVATAIVVWAADHDGKASVGTADVERYWKGTPLKVPANLPRDISKAVKSGWLIRDGKELTATGFGREAIGLSAS
jgi:hypothetical protein